MNAFFPAENLAEFTELQKTKADSPKSWSVDEAAIDPKTFDLSVKNPNGGEEISHHSPAEIMEEMARGDADSAEILEWSRPCYENVFLRVLRPSA